MKFLKMILMLASTIMLAQFSLADDLTPQQQECQDFQTEIPAYFTKGSISVPEDWNHPEGRKINVYYYGNFGEKNETPVVFFNGGPTFPSHVTFGQFQTESKSSDVPIVYIDQRGTGCSDPYPQELTQEAVNRIGLYGSRAIVKDAEAIRKKILKNRKWKVFGQSYGGLVAHRYLEIAPEGIAELYIHGNSIPKDWHQFYKERLLAQKRVAEDYFKKYPDDKALLKRIREQISPKTCFNNEYIQICGENVMDAPVLGLGFPSNWGNIHEAVHSVVDKDGNLLPKRLLRFVSLIIFSSFAPSGLPVAVIAKMEMNSADDNDQCTEALKSLKADGETPELWSFNECRLAMDIQYKESDSNANAGQLLENFKKKDPLSLELIKKNLTTYSKLQMHLYSGHLDVYVPESTFTDEVNYLGSQIHYINFTDSGHDGYLVEPTLWDDIKKRVAL